MSRFEQDIDQKKSLFEAQEALKADLLQDEAGSILRAFPVPGLPKYQKSEKTEFEAACEAWREAIFAISKETSSAADFLTGAAAVAAYPELRVSIRSFSRTLAYLKEKERWKEYLTLYGCMKRATVSLAKERYDWEKESFIVRGDCSHRLCPLCSERYWRRKRKEAIEAFGAQKFVHYWVVSVPPELRAFHLAEDFHDNARLIIKKVGDFYKREFGYLPPILAFLHLTGEKTVREDLSNGVHPDEVRATPHWNIIVGGTGLSKHMLEYAEYFKERRKNLKHRKYRLKKRKEALLQEMESAALLHSSLPPLEDWEAKYRRKRAFEKKVFQNEKALEEIERGFEEIEFQKELSLELLEAEGPDFFDHFPSLLIDKKKEIKKDAIFERVNSYFTRTYDRRECKTAGAPHPEYKARDGFTPDLVDRFKSEICTALGWGENPQAHLGVRRGAAKIAHCFKYVMRSPGEGDDVLRYRFLKDRQSLVKKGGALASGGPGSPISKLWKLSKPMFAGLDWKETLEEIEAEETGGLREPIFIKKWTVFGDLIVRTPNIDSGEFTGPAPPDSFFTPENFAFAQLNYQFREKNKEISEKISMMKSIFNESGFFN